MATIIDPPNSVWPNGLKVDSEGYVTFYPMGTNKVDITTITWPDGDTLISPFVYKDDKLVGFVDTKALTVSGNVSTTMNYSHIEADFSSIEEGDLVVDAPNAAVKKFTWAVVAGEGGGSTFDYIIIDFNNTDQATLDAVRAAYKVVDKKMYDVDGNIIGTWDTSKLEVGGIYNYEAGIYDGLYCGWNEEFILTEFDSDLGSLIDGTEMFDTCLTLTTFTSNLSSLANGRYMFSYCENLSNFTSDLSTLIEGVGMFDTCLTLTTFTSNLSSLTVGASMFQCCENLTSFTADLSSLTDGTSMFNNCFNLTTFTSDLSSLTDGYMMFDYCKLDAPSVQNIAQTINTVTNNPYLYISIGRDSATPEDKAAFQTIREKGWDLYVGYNSSVTSEASAVATLDETDETQTVPTIYWAKSVPSDEKRARYTDSEGNYFNILGGNLIYVDDPETYGMFLNEEDAAAQMRLTKIEKPFVTKFNRN